MSASGRRLLSGAIACAAASAALATAAVPTLAAPAAKPNIVVVMTDDQRADDMVVMPKTERLIGAAGTTFRNSYVSYSLCCPSRTTFLTGQYSHNHHVTWNFAPQGGYERFAKLGQTNTLPVWLQRAGYHTGLIGKYLNEYGEKRPTEVPPGWDDWQGSVDPSTYQAYDYTLNVNGRLVHYGHDPADYMTDVYTDRAVDYIRRNAPSPKPFFLWVTPNAPHTQSNTGRVEGTPALPAPRDADVFANAQMPMAPNFDEADMSDKPAIVQRFPAMGPEQRATALAHFRGRRGSLLGVDDMVERVVDELRATGELDNTVIVFTSDNGWLLGEHRVVGQKYFGFEESIKVPLLVRGPGFPRGRVSTDMAMNVDLAPTIARAAGARMGRPADGVALQSVVEHPGRLRDRDMIIETGPNSLNLPYYTGLHTKRYAYEEITTGERELYDLQRDPYELRSVDRDPAYAGVERILAARLDKLRHCRGRACHSSRGSPKPRPPADARPNVLLIMTDDQTAADTRYMPNVQRLLADKGTTFSNAITSFPLCCPSRASFLTGQFAHNHGVSGNFAPEGWYGLKGKDNTLPAWLESSGYFTSLIGKWLNGYGARGPTEVPVGFSDWHGMLDLSAYNYFNFTINENGALHTWGDPSYAQRLNDFAIPIEQQQIQSLADFIRLLGATFVPGDFGTARAADYTVDVTAGITDDVLRGQAGAKNPFFVWWTPAAPHREDVDTQRPGYPWLRDPRPAPQDEALAATYRLPRPPSFDEADMRDKPPLLQELPRLDATTLTRLEHNYQGRIASLQAVDRNVAKLVSTLRETGELENTVIVFTSDNGWVQGQHRIAGDKFVPYEESLRVPLIVRGPGFEAGRTVRRAVSNVDLTPTLLELAGARAGRVQDGLPIQRVMREPAGTPSRALPIEATGKLFAAEGFPQEYDRPYSGVRTDRWKYVRWTDGGFRELYDLKRDPYELRNLAGAPRYAKTVARMESMRARLARCRGRACNDER